MPGSNPNANPFGLGQAPGSNPSANPFGQAPGSNPAASPYNVVSLPQYDMSRMAAREATIRRVVWIIVLAVAVTIGLVILAR